GGDVARKGRGEAGGDGGGAGRAGACRGDAVVADVVAESRDEDVAARCAARVLEIPDGAGQVPRVDEAQTRLAADPGRGLQHGGRRVPGLCHLVVAVERGDVPGNVDRHAGDELRETRQLLT